MEFDLSHTISLLSRTPAVLKTLLGDLPETWTLRNEGENTWSAFDVVGHLIHGERTDWMPRTRMILQSGEAQTFELFDRWGHARESQGKSLGQLLEEFAGLRSGNLSELRALNLRQEAWGGSQSGYPQARQSPHASLCCEFNYVVSFSFVFRLFLHFSSCSSNNSEIAFPFYFAVLLWRRPCTRWIIISRRLRRQVPSG